MPDLSTWLLLAQEAAKPAGEAAASPAPGLMGFLPAFALMAVFFYFIILKPQRAKDQQFRTMVDNLKETSRVVTIGGIHGVVTNVDKGEGRDTIITLRVDDSTGTKIRVGANAISKVVTDE